MFFAYTDLGSFGHVTQSAVMDAYKICMKIKQTFKYAKIVCIPLNYAARSMATALCQMLRQRGLDNLLVSRDPCHCLDLTSKDMAGTDIVKSIFMESVEVYHFCIMSRMDGIRRESIAFNELEDSGTVKNAVENCMNLIHIHLTSARK